MASVPRTSRGVLVKDGNQRTGSRTLASASKCFSYLTHGYVMPISHKCGQLEAPRTAELRSRRGQSFGSCAPSSPSALSAEL